MSATELIGWAIMTVSLPAMLWGITEQIRTARAQRRHLDTMTARHAVENDELLLMRCEIWKRCGSTAHDSHCRLCNTVGVNSNERGQA